ncbi:MAG: hypothetical protein WAU39_02855 [Polyangiales bacterium]
MTRAHQKPHPQRLLRVPIATVIMACLVGGLAGCGSSGDHTDVPDNSSAGGSGGAAGAGGSGGSIAAPSEDGGTAGLEQNPVEQLLADPQRNPGAFLGMDAQGVQGYGDAAIACYTAPEACAATECGAFASCCVDTASCCKPVTDGPALPGMLDFANCAGLTLGQCTEREGTSATSFGPREPLLTGRGLVPNGTATSEGGALIGEVVNLSSDLVELDVQFTLPLGCNGTCLESAGVAFTSSMPDVFVDAEVGLLLSGSRETVSLLIGGSVADSFDGGTDDTVWSLVLSPSGSVEVDRDGVPQGVYPFDSALLTEASLVVFGRNVNVADTSAAIARIELRRHSCDNPRAWIDRQPTAVLVQGEAVTTLHAPSIAKDDTTTWIAFEWDGQIFVGEPQQSQLVIETGPALAPSEPYEALGIGDPELVWDGSALRLFYTARDGDGTGTIQVAVATPSQGVFARSGVPMLVPSEDVTSFDAPTVIFRDGLWLMVVRATLSTGVTELQAYYTSDLQTGWARIIGGGLEPLTRISGSTSELTSPSLIIHNSAYHLYYARRAGTRWSVELAVSDELLLWRSIGVVLGPSGLGFDELGASGPDALSEPDRIDLVYAGQDGISFQLGSASRPAPSDSALTIF